MEEENKNNNFVLNSELGGGKGFSNRNRDLLEKHIESLQEKEVSFRDPIDKEVEKQLPDIRKHVLEYFSNLGIEDVKFPQKITQLDTLSNFGNLGRVDISEVVVHDFLDVKNLPLRQYLQARMVLHEAYHYAAPFKLADNDSEIHEERTGLSYDEHDGVLEEAMAVHFELESEKLLKDKFAEGHEKHRELEAQSMKDPENAGKIYRVTSQRDNSDYFERSYVDANLMTLYEKLHQTVPEFDRIVEEARINHKTIKLAREIEKVYGRETYQFLMKAKYEDIDNLLEYLDK